MPQVGQFARALAAVMTSLLLFVQAAASQDGSGWGDDPFYPFGTWGLSTQTQPEIGYAPTRPPAKIEREQKYFPPGAFGLSTSLEGDVESAAFLEHWYGDQLAAMEEVPLWDGEPRASDITTVRLLFLPSFAHGAVLRLAIPDSGEMTYVFKRASGAGGYAPGILAVAKEGSVAPAMAARISALLAQVRDMPPTAPKASDGTFHMCMDGTQTVIEIAGKGDYAAIERHECEIPNGDPLRLLIEAMNAASGGKVIAPYTFDPDTGEAPPEIGLEFKF